MRVASKREKERRREETAVAMTGEWDLRARIVRIIISQVRKMEICWRR